MSTTCTTIATPTAFKPALMTLILPLRPARPAFSFPTGDPIKQPQPELLSSRILAPSPVLKPGLSLAPISEEEQQDSDDDEQEENTWEEKFAGLVRCPGRKMRGFTVGRGIEMWWRTARSTRKITAKTRAVWLNGGRLGVIYEEEEGEEEDY